MTRLLLILALLAPAAAKAEQPTLIPGRDVAIQYRLSGAAADQIPGGAPDGVRLVWDATGQRLRAEPIGRPMYALTDLPHRVADIVFAGQGAYMQTRIKGGDPQTLLAGRDIRFTRRGTEHLLGMECTVWTIQSQKINGTGCVTAQGVILRAEGMIDGRPGSLVAQSVVFGPQPNSAFVPPDGYSRMSLPGMN